MLLAAFVLSLPAVTPRIYASDEVQYFSYLRSLWFDRDVSFENEYRYFYDRNVARGEGFHATFLEDTTPAGRRRNFGTIGCALLWSPFYAVGDATARALRAAGRDVEADGFSTPYIAAVAYGSATYGFLAVLLSVGAARRLLSAVEERTAPGAGLAGGLLIWAGTPLLFYMYVVAADVACLLGVRRRGLRHDLAPRAAHLDDGAVVLLGLSAGVMAMVREQDVFFVVGPAVDYALSQAAPGRSRWRALGTAVAGCLAFAVAFLPQLVAYSGSMGMRDPRGW